MEFWLPWSLTYAVPFLSGKRFFGKRRVFYECLRSYLHTIIFVTKSFPQLICTLFHSFHLSTWLLQITLLTRILNLKPFSRKKHTKSLHMHTYFFIQQQTHTHIHMYVWTNKQEWVYSYGLRSTRHHRANISIIST